MEASGDTCAPNDVAPLIQVPVTSNDNREESHLIYSCSEPIKRRSSRKQRANTYEALSLGEDRPRTKKSYWELLTTNRQYLLYLMSYIANHIGEWLTYIASLSAIESIQYHQSSSSNASETTTSGVAISRLVIVRLLPNVLLAPFGGVLADGLDRRQVMIALDLAGAAVAWLYMLAVELESIPMIYVATFCQQSLSGLYEPSRSAIVPLLVPNEDDLQKATTISGVAWSAVSAFATATGGFIVATLGLRACYLTDCFTYIVSAILMTMLGGKWSVSSSAEDGPNNDDSESPASYIRGMVSDGMSYLRRTFFGALVLLKASCALTYGGFDVLNVAFSEHGSVDGRPFRLGLLFSAVGVGCAIGPLVCERFLDMSKPTAIQLSCLLSMLCVAFGSMLQGLSHQAPFWMICILSAVRAAGASALWINSSLLLQKFSLPSMLGRVLSIDYSLALLTEALSAFLAGSLQDDLGLSAPQVSLVLGSVAVVFLAVWYVYHFQGKGAGEYVESDSQEHDKMPLDSNSDRPSLPSEITNLLPHA